MNLLFIATIVTLSCFSLAHPTENELTTAGRLTKGQKQDLRRRIKAAGGCNANICFAVDGSNALKFSEYRAELDFILDVVSVVSVDIAVELAAVQYGIANSPISPLTTDIVDFIKKVDNEQRLRSRGSNLVGGINYCFSQLFDRPGEANKMVVLGDGRSTIGNNAIARADLFRKETGGKICTVGAGFRRKKRLLKIAGGDKSLVFRVDSFLDVLALERVVEKLVEDICGL